MITAEQARKQAIGDYNLDQVLEKIESRIDQASRNFQYSTLIVEEPFYIWASSTDLANNVVANTANAILTEAGYTTEWNKSPRGLKISWQPKTT